MPIRNPDLIGSSIPTNGNGFINTSSFNSASGFKESNPVQAGADYLVDNYSSVSSTADDFSRTGGLAISPSDLSSNASSSAADDYMSYLQGLFTSLGQQNDLNRAFNEEQARVNREFNALEAEKSRQFKKKFA